MVLPLVLATIFVAGVSYANADETALQSKTTVELKITIDDESQTFKPVKHVDGMTVGALMKQIAEASKTFEFKSRGKGETFFVTSINKKKNEGARGNNWIFFVNGELGDESAGSYELEPGDKVEWKFQKYRP